MNGQKSGPITFTAFIQGLNDNIPSAPNEGFRKITDEELRDWNKIYYAFRSHSYDSCKLLLAKYHYSLVQMNDPKMGVVYDVIKENTPIERGWGTFVHNRHYAKRLFVEVTHPVDDQHVLAIGSELFRRTQAEWLLIAGAGKHASEDNFSSDAARVRRNLLQRWHELITDLTHVSLSLHGYKKDAYGFPVSETDIVVSNGRTSDIQWGISQISLKLRDSLREAGFSTSIAMYDSGFAPLAGGGNPQSTFSNDSVGFGHWMNIELSNAVRNDPSEYNKFITCIDHALDITGGKVSQQINRAFGLVSPRVVRLDSLHHMQFPSLGQGTYRIISISEDNKRSDTIDVRMGNWFGTSGSVKTLTTITKINSDEGIFNRRERGTSSHAAASDSPTLESYAKIVAAHHTISDSTSFDDEESSIGEPLQVHRIPLRPYFISGRARAPLYRWEGIIRQPYSMIATSFGMSGDDAENGVNEQANLFVPIINSSYAANHDRYIGIQMTNVLVQEIARLVTEHRENEKDIRLLAEQSDNGSYYLRIFPAASEHQLALLKR